MSAGIIQANGSMMAEPRIDVRHVADAVLYLVDANVLTMTMMATAMPLN